MGADADGSSPNYDTSLAAYYPLSKERTLQVPSPRWPHPLTLTLIVRPPESVEGC